MQQRRPHKRHGDTSIPLGSQDPRSPAETAATTIKKRRRRRRQGQPKLLRRGETITLLCSKRRRLIVQLLSSCILVFCCYWLLNHFSFGSKIEGRVRQHLHLYDEIHRIAIENNSTDVSEAQWPDYGQHKARPPALLGPGYGLSVTEVCDLTVLFLDPRLGDPQYGPGRSAWFALESIGAFAPQRPAAITTCVLLLTSSCSMQAYLEEIGAASGTTTRFDAEEAVRDKVYASSLPLFREMIHDGRVRLSFLDDDNVDKYQLKSCNDFGSLHFLMNVHFWKDEFTDLDSDTVLLIQDDSVLCHRRGGGGGQVVGGSSFLEQYKDYAYVGGVWPRQADPLRPFPPEGMCAGMPARWKSWLLPQRRWEKWNAAGGQTKTTANAPPKPRELLQTSFPAICEDGLAPIGNGGFSLRSRSWLIRAIETCPHVKHSGLDTSAASAGLACKVMDAIDEDFYFGVVLRGIGAPLPSAVEASLFAVEMLWPEELGLSSNKYTSPAHLNGTERSRLFQSFPTVRNKSPPTRSDKSAPPVFTVPYGVHKVWWYHPNELLLSSEMKESCPYLQYIFEPSMSRWHELHSEQRWAGIGS